MFKPILYLLALILIVVGISVGAMTLGDNFLNFNNFGNAEKFYKISQSTNPFNPNIEQRILALNVAHDERNRFAEESGLPGPGDNLIKIPANPKVLGDGVVLPVLMYHYIRINPDPNDKVGFNLSVTPENFDKQMSYLKFSGYHTISLDEFGQALKGNSVLPSRPIVITLDDGYVDSYTEAYPILKKYGLKGVNFVITGLVGAPHYLTWPQIEELSKSDVIDIESHTVHHYALTYLSPEKVKFELLESQKEIAAHIGHLPKWFAYPYGNVNAKVVPLVEQAGYDGAFGTNNGTFESEKQLYTLPRVRIGGGISLDYFAKLLPWR